MAVIYKGTNPAFIQLVEELEHPIAAAVDSGRFRSHDTYNRKKYPLTAALLDLLCAPYSRKLHRWHHQQCLVTVKRGIPLDFIDIETDDI